MKNVKESLHLRQVFSRMLLFRLFIPLMLVSLAMLIGFGFYEEGNVKNHQNQVAQSITNFVDYHIDHGARTLDAIGRVCEQSSMEETSVFMKSTWESYCYFETLYCLDKDNKIMLMTPSDSTYSGLDMSNLPDFKDRDEGKNLFISRPFMSIRTGSPTVYLVRPLSNGGCVVGELNLGLLQQEITHITDKVSKDFVYIMDQNGMVIASQDWDLVKLQTNMSNLQIYHSVLRGESNAVYLYNGNYVIGSAVRSERTGWIIVDQTLLSVFLSTYEWIFVLIFLAALIICLTLVWDIRKELKRYVINPVEQLSERTNALTVGDFNRVKSLEPISTAFFEINELLIGFQSMSDNLQVRETALRESEKRYRGLVERLQIGLFCAKMTGQVLEVNPELSSILQCNFPEQLVDINIISLLYRLLMDSELGQYIRENVFNLDHFEAKIRRDDGEVIWVQINTHIVYDYRGMELFFEGTIQDITERKCSEAKIKEQQEHIFKAEKEQREVLENALVMKDEFISLISHEFKTPLNVIYSAIQLIESVYFEKTPERVQELVGTIKQNTFRQLRLANNLLDVTRINSGQFKLNMKNIDIVFVAKVITQSVELYATQKNIKVSFKSNIQTKIISIDEEKFERIILNILSNAIKFTESGGTIVVTLDENKSSNTIQIKIADTGIGIPKDKQELIFERFGQVDSNLSRRAEGTGIGLSLVKLLVSILEGTIVVESEVGVGSTFIINLPIKELIVEKEAEEFIDDNSRLSNEIKVQFSDIYF